MDLATLQAIWTVVQGILSFVVQYGPGMLVDIDNIIADLKLAWASATSGTPITADQQTQIDNALDAANEALAAAVAKATASDNAG